MSDAELYDLAHKLIRAGVHNLNFVTPDHFWPHVERLCRRLRSKLPDLKIMVCRWSLPEKDAPPDSLLAAGATWVTSSITEAREILEELPGRAQRESKP